MRKPRIKISDGSAVYHCIGRVVGGQFLLGDVEKERLRQLLWDYADFCGVEVITYCLMSNHFHVLVRVPEVVAVSDAELLAKVTRLYGRKSPLVQTMTEHFQKFGVIPEDLRESFRARMGDVSGFMKELKQRFTKWYNKQYGRFGTLWAERFKSVLVEDEPGAVGTVAMYVDLNPVRAGLMEDPAEYRFCGYAEAVAGNGAARRGIRSFHETGPWKRVAAAYREALLVQSGTANRSGKSVLEREVIREKLKAGVELSKGQVLRLRVRYFSDGLVLGSRNYVNEVFAEYRDRFGPRRKTGARRLRALGQALGGLSAARDLRVTAVS